MHNENINIRKLHNSTARPCHDFRANAVISLPDLDRYAIIRRYSLGPDEFISYDFRSNVRRNTVTNLSIISYSSKIVTIHVSVTTKYLN